jgi:hypothetical protein
MLPLQVMGPDDGYICQFSKDQSTFWAARNSLELGACIKAAPTYTGRRAPQRMVAQVRHWGTAQQQHKQQQQQRETLGHRTEAAAAAAAVQEQQHNKALGHVPTVAGEPGALCVPEQDPSGDAVPATSLDCLGLH